MVGSKNNVEVEVNDGCHSVSSKQIVIILYLIDRSSYYIWQCFTVSNSSEAKKGGAKIAACKFL